MAACAPDYHLSSADFALIRYSLYLLCFTATLALVGCGTSMPANPFADAPSYSASNGAIEHVVHISVDGLRPDAVVRWLDDLPAYNRLRTQGAFTDNARTAPTRGNTLPNHASQFTGRVVAGPEGHGWSTNRDPGSKTTLHSNHGAYVTSVFDVVRGAGQATALFASKAKFDVFHRSYEDAIDVYVDDVDTDALTEQFVDSLRTGTYAYAFLHLRDPDTIGHRYGWWLRSWHPYARAVRKTDRLIGRVLDAIDADPDLRGTTAVIVTTDHGGHGRSHGPNDRRDYTIPFYVWGPGIPAGSLYDFAGDTRADPGDEQIAATAADQPIRNGDAANLALSLLGLDPIPDSTIGANEPLLRHDDNLTAP